MTTPTLPAFLAARYDEQEADAGHVYLVWNFFEEDGAALRDDVLADLAAKRLILTRLAAHWDGDEYDDDAELARYVARALALPFAEHPDYREEWAL